MFKRIGKVISLTLVIALMVTAANGCTSKEKTSTNNSTANTSTPVVKEKYIIDYLTSPTADKPIMTSDTVIGKMIEDKFGIVFRRVEYSGNLRDKQSLMLAAGDFMEIQPMERDDMVMNYIAAGALINLDPYLSKMPDFVKRFKEQIPYWRLPGEGKLYKWEQNVPNSNFENLDLYVRSDLLEQNNWKHPVAASDWVKFFVNAKKNNPTTPSGLKTVGVTASFAESWGIAGVSGIMYEKGDTYPAIGNSFYLYNSKQEQFEDYFQNPYVKESYKFFNDLWRAGVLDEECFTSTKEITQEKAVNSQALAIWYPASCNPNSILMQNGQDKYIYILCPIQSDTQYAQKQKRLQRQETTRPYSSIGITKNCKDPERVLELINYSCTDEGSILLRTGIEGQHYTMVNGKRVESQLYVDLCSNKPEFKEAVAKTGLNWLPNFGLPYFKVKLADGSYPARYMDEDYSSKYSTSTFAKKVETVYSNMGYKSNLQWWQDNVVFVETGLSGVITIDPTSETGRIGSKMLEVRTKNTPKLIMSNSESDFSKRYQDAMAEYDLLNHKSVINEMNRLLSEKLKLVKEYKSK